MARRKYSISPLELVNSLWSNFDLVMQMTKREVIGRYRGSVVGLMWSLFNPILMLAVYTFVFSVVFKVRWPITSGNKYEFAILLFAGMIVHGLFSECINRSPTLIISNVQYVKKVVFPLEVLPWVTVFTAVFHALMSIGVLLVFYSIVYLKLNWTVMYAPVVLLPFLILTLGVSWFLSSMGVYIRDIAHITGILTMILLFVSPIFYPISALPEQFQIYAYLNPLTFIIQQMREVIVIGNPPDWSGLGIYLVFSVAIAWSGMVWFQKTRRGFADVL